jgi:DNA-binding LytR/AlgR family response regulator
LNEEKIQKIEMKFQKLFNNSDEKIKPYLYIKSNLKKRKVYTKDIKWVEALGDYVKVITSNSNIIVLSSLRSFEKKLPINKFLRIHKSYIINLDRVDNLSNKTVEIESNLIPVSRNKKAELEKMLESK